MRSFYVIIPIFNWLNRWINNFGIIILLLTLILKTALFPLTYRSYKSQAVMRVLKPQVDEIGAKYPKKEELNQCKKRPEKRMYNKNSQPDPNRKIDKICFVTSTNDIMYIPGFATLLDLLMNEEDNDKVMMR